MTDQITEESLKDLPAIRIVDGEKTFDFNSYDQLYAWCRSEGSEYNLAGMVTGSAELVFLFGECPLRYSIQEHRLQALGTDLKWEYIHDR